MTTTINASTTAGLVNTADTSGVLALQTAGTTAVSISASQVVTLTNALPVASGGSGVTTSTGSGANVLGTSPTLTTPTINSAQVDTVSGTAPLYFARAWVNFNGTGTVAIRASGNVSSITDNGTSDYTVNFTSALADANYAAVGITGSTSGGSAQMLTPEAAQTTTTCRIKAWVWNASTADPSYVSLAIFR